MDDRNSSSLQPLVAMDGAPVFAEAWQAEALALADTLVQNGVFSARAWSNALGVALAAAHSNAAVDDQDTYYHCVLVALETLIAGHSEIDREAMKRKRLAWERAYRATPHGQPVVLDTDR